MQLTRSPADVMGKAGGANRSQVQTLLEEFRTVIEALEVVVGAGGSLLPKETKALLDADLAHDANTVALVFGDATAANNTFYYKVGASGSGSWFQFSGGIALTNAIPQFTQPPLQVINQADSGAVGSGVELFRDRASPADDEFGIAIHWRHRDDAGSNRQVAEIVSQMLDASAGSVDGALRFQVPVNGSYASGTAGEMQFGPGLRVGNLSTLTDQGRGAVNAEAYYLNNAERLTQAESSDLSITTDTVLTWTHGLGAKPKPQNVAVVLVCQTTDLGYAVGEEIIIGTYGWEDGSNDEGVTVSIPDATTIDVIIGNDIRIADRAGPGEMQVITFANWRVKIYAQL